jgi:hypothetical protein
MPAKLSPDFSCGSRPGSHHTFAHEKSGLGADIPLPVGEYLSGLIHRMNSDIVPVKSFTFRHEAECAQQILESAHIVSVLSGDDASGWAPHIGLATGGITLLVNQIDLEQARRLIEGEDAQQ